MPRVPITIGVVVIRLVGMMQPARKVLIAVQVYNSCTLLCGFNLRHPYSQNDFYSSHSIITLKSYLFIFKDFCIQVFRVIHILGTV